MIITSWSFLVSGRHDTFNLLDGYGRIGLQNNYYPWLPDYGVIFFEQKVRCIPVRLSEIEFCLITFNPEMQIFHMFSDDDVPDVSLHGYVVSSLMDTAYWSSEIVSEEGSLISEFAGSSCPNLKAFLILESELIYSFVVEHGNLGFAAALAVLITGASKRRQHVMIHIAFNVSLRMFTRSVVIQRRVEDLQLGVESYQKKLNLTKPDTYRSNLRRRDAYTPYSDPRGFIYENKDKKNRLMRIDELHKFSDGTLDDVRTALNDRLKGIRMEYLPQTFWSQRDKANARAMIQAIDKRLKTRRIMRSLERFVGGRPYGGDLRLLQRTI
ncbi:hypothetical protein Tco_0576447 [Tanacetum coccineum]